VTLKRIYLSASRPLVILLLEGSLCLSITRITSARVLGRLYFVDVFTLFIVAILVIVDQITYEPSALRLEIVFYPGVVLIHESGASKHLYFFAGLGLVRVIYDVRTRPF